MTTAVDSIGNTHDQLAALISYLRDLHALRNPPIRNIAQHAAFRLDSNRLKDMPGVVLSPNDDVWLTTELLVPPAEPPLPADLVEVAVPRLVGKDRPVAREDAQDADRAKLEQWTSRFWDIWKQDVKRFEASRRLYLDLFEVRDQLEADSSSLEFIWGFGIVRWHEHDIEYPLFTVGLEIEYTAEVARLEVRPNRPLRAETEVLTGLPLVAQRQLFDAMTAIEDNDIDPWHQELGPDVLTPLLLMMSHASPEDAGPKILDDVWTIFVRRKPSGYLSFVRGLEGNLESLANLPTMASLVAKDPWRFDIGSSDSTASGEGWVSSGSRVLLPLPANDEQREILRYASSSPGVTVEGPPGTGKSHTIANLISGFIADGKRVLVTAERPQALKVLLDKIPEALQPLCVPVLGSGQEERMRLENSIDRISQATFGLDSNRADADRLPLELDEISRSIAKVHNLLREARKVEVQPVPDFVPAECQGSRAIVAEWLHKHETNYSFVNDALPPDSPLPWTTAEIEKIIKVLGSVPITDLHRSLEVATPHTLPSGEELRQRDHDRDAWLRLVDNSPGVIGGTELQSEEELESLERLVELASTEVSDWQTGIRHNIFEELADGPKAELWRTFAKDISVAVREAYSLRAMLQAHQVDIPGEAPFGPAESNCLREAQAIVDDGKRLGFTQRQARHLLRECRVDGRVPLTASDIALVVALSDLRSIRSRISNQLNSERNSLGISSQGSVAPEDEASPISVELLSMVDWLDTKGPTIQSRLEQLGVQFDNIADSSAIKTAHSAIQARLAASRVARLQREHELLLDQLSLQMETSTAGDLWQLLNTALAERDWSSWDETVTEIHRLSAIQPLSREFNELIHRLAERAPLWAEHLRSTGNIPAQNANEVELAWTWRRIEEWFRSTEAKGDASELEEELQRLERVQQNLVGQLAAARAWLAVTQRIDGPTQGALAAYKTVNARLGKGYSKFKNTYQRQLNEALVGCRDVIPAWVMPVERVLTDFVCEAEPIFDVLIIDEASQLPMTRLPILALARKVIVVGDDKQISPSLPGVEIQPSLDALKNRLGSIPNAGATYFIEASVYDVAMQRFPRKVQLREHFRCLTPIIEFSNARYYDERLVPLRDRMPTLHWKPLNSVFVDNGFRDSDDCNRPEAERIAELISELVRIPEYTSRSFGVITLLGRNQSKLVHDLVFEAIGPAKMAAHSVRIGDAAVFQGDERDVVFISTVVSDSGGRTIGAMTHKRHQQMVNVAASRARDQLWVVHSVPAEAFPNGDERAALIRHCSATVSSADAYEELAKKTDAASPFERDLLRHLVGRGYRTIRPQHKVGRYQIDFVIDGPSSRLAIECDGDRFHGPEQWESDRSRQTVLERAGWTFVRIRGSAFYRNPGRALEPLWKKLEELQIPPYDWTAQLPQAPAPPSETTTTGVVPASKVDVLTAEALPRSGKEPTNLAVPGGKEAGEAATSEIDRVSPPSVDDPWAAAFQAADEQIREQGKDNLR